VFDAVVVIASRKVNLATMQLSASIVAHRDRDQVDVVSFQREMNRAGIEQVYVAFHVEGWNGTCLTTILCICSMTTSMTRSIIISVWDATARSFQKFTRELALLLILLVMSESELVCCHLELETRLTSRLRHSK
jgi:hypothetical protein